MAIVKIHSITQSTKTAIDYIKNPEKTDEELLVSSYNCDVDFAEIEFEMTRQLAKHVSGNYTRTGGADIQSYHIIQSFSPADNVTPEQAHEIGRELISQFTDNKHEFVISTHIDKGHIHNHIIVNATSFYTHKKLRTRPFVTSRELLNISNKLCQEHQLSTMEYENDFNRHYTDYQVRRHYKSYRMQLKERLRFIEKHATSFNDFMVYAHALDVEVSFRGKQTLYRLKDVQQRFIRSDTLDDKDRFSKQWLEQYYQQHKDEQTQHELQDIKKMFEAYKREKESHFVFHCPLETSEDVKSTASGLNFVVNGYTFFVDFSHVVDDKMTPLLAINRGYEYEGVSLDTDKKIVIRGEQLLRHIQLQQQQKGTTLSISQQDILSLTKRGVKIKIDDNILFVEKKFIDVNTLTGNVSVTFFNDWHYALSHKKGEYVSVSGRDLIGHFMNNKEQDIVSSYALQSYKKQLNKEELHTLSKTLNMLRQKQAGSLSDVDVILSDILKEADRLKRDIQKLDSHIQTYNSVATLLVTYHDYLPIKLETQKNPTIRHHYTRELQLFNYAEKELSKHHIDVTVPKEKVVELVKKQESDRNKLKEKLATVEQQLQDVRQAKQVMQDLNKKVKREKEKDKGVELS
ncbi:relaxase/mobilization nuclease domain-containing protein [Granulicatella sp. zg-ZJ]|uniref:relaxase/mobilization nuclease domain-containing protein n=1 Tax=Granulicatella sp. zg-ZJ TaxID=2678504 RepID=UPI0013CF76CE|nr:relaxase/mobilization nuclease domain-containing protein [Granulicatella sp. zg-ZJ]MBS4749598.1 relaxase/mobilization nuclease domain-containing protein [Carnobacteriaceae bacterium zg-ZUI78]NEW62426.1 relaxase/mobilization nuclease domain-containing protein [Granulicatella sp. zg-ZJ]NEW62972.1 relaxase/mobilization nuclease domain-containing protein [Granulicatella sp. zg-ZJ]